MNQGIIVFGANGFIGTRLVSRASRRGQRVTAVDIAPPRIRLDGVDYVDADVRKPISVSIGRRGIRRMSITRRMFSAR